MPRLNKLDDVLFPVIERPVFTSYTEDGVERRFAVPEKKAIINRASNCVLGVVSRGYHLVTNREALEMAHRCCRTVFPETNLGEWAIKGVDAPSTAGYCHIDLVHNSAVLDFDFVPAGQRPEVFGPFIRLTNSYNGLRALRFDIGFFRKVCENGLILPESIIRFSFNHQRRDLGETIRFEIAKDRLTKFRTAFTASLAGLRNCAVSRSQFRPLLWGVLLLRPPEPESSGEMEWKTLSTHLSEIINRYADELGENAYAAFNAITEFASHPPANRCLHRDRNSLQRLAGSWLTSFNAACRMPGFSITRYIELLEKESANAIALTPDQIRSQRRRTEAELFH